MKARAVELEAGKSKPDVADYEEETPEIESPETGAVNDEKTFPVDEEVDNA